MQKINPSLRGKAYGKIDSNGDLYNSCSCIGWLQYFKGWELSCNNKIKESNFYSTNNAIAVEVDDSVIQYTTSYAENGVPKKDGEANFNKDTGTPYAILEDGMVVVLIDNEWIEFKAK